MNLIGRKSPSFRLPAWVNGDLTYADSDDFAGRWLALSFVPSLGLLEVLFLDRQRPRLSQLGTTWLIVPPHAWTFDHLPSGTLEAIRLCIGTDPLSRLHHAYGLPRVMAPGRCQSWLVDPDGIVRFQIVHDLNGRGLNALLELLEACQGCEAKASPPYPVRRSDPRQPATPGIRLD